jgi:hypothetical protein
VRKVCGIEADEKGGGRDWNNRILALKPSSTLIIGMGITSLNYFGVLD